MGRTMAHAMHDHVLFEVHSEEIPGDREWEEFLASFPEYVRHGVAGTVVVTDGPGPNAMQRRRLSAARLDADVPSVPTAVVTRSIVARGAVTAMNWMGHALKAFPPEQVEDALRYANVAPIKIDVALHMVARLKCELVGVSMERLKVAVAEGALAPAARNDVVTSTVEALRKRVAR